MKPFDRSAAHGLMAITVMRNGKDYQLCPFFGKCDGLLLIGTADASAEFKPNIGCNAEFLAELIVASRVERLICGFIPQVERAKLRAAGIDVRLGSCVCGIDELFVAFSDLPQA